MKTRSKLMLSALLVVFIVVSQQAYAGFNFITARVLGSDGKTETIIMSAEEYKAMSKRFSMERLLATKAHRIAEGQWKEGESELRYKGREALQRKVTKTGSFQTQEKANKKLAMWQSKNNKSGGGKSSKSSRNNSNRKEKLDKNVYPTRLPRTSNNNGCCGCGKRNNNRGGGNNNNNNNNNRNSQANDAKKLVVLQRNWINRAHAINLYSTAMNEIIEEKSPGLGYELTLIEDIPEPPPMPDLKNGDGEKKEIKRLGGGVGSLTGKSHSILGKKVEMK